MSSVAFAKSSVNKSTRLAIALLSMVIVDFAISRIEDSVFKINSYFDIVFNYKDFYYL